eukprot:8318915-Pyramimonas_sp.AAC.1
MCVYESPWASVATGSCRCPDSRHEGRRVGISVIKRTSQSSFMRPLSERRIFCSSVPCGMW